MRSTAVPSDLFAAHYVDPLRPHAGVSIARQLLLSGLVTVDGLASRDAVLRFAASVMEIAAHRDSDPDRLTTLYDTGRHAHRPGFAGLGCDALPVHTDCSHLPSPPRLLLMICAQAGVEGGDVLLADGRAVHADLAERTPEAASVLAKPRTAYFGAGDGHLSQVFTVHRCSGQVSVRLRQDALARWSPLARPYLPYLQDAIARREHRFVLAPGQGYLLDNHRWLHGRTPFRGDRRCWRALGTPRFPLPSGFTPWPAAVAGPSGSKDVFRRGQFPGGAP